MASNATLTPGTARPLTPGSTHSPSLSPSTTVRRLSRQGSRSGGGKVLSAVLQFEQVIAAQQTSADRTHRTFSLGRGSTAQGSPVLPRSQSSDVSAHNASSVDIGGAQTTSSMVSLSAKCTANHVQSDAGGAQTTETIQDPPVSTAPTQGPTIISTITPEEALTRRYMVKLEQDPPDGASSLDTPRGPPSFARRRSDTEPLMVDVGGDGDSSSEGSESSVDLLSSPSKGSNRESKEIGEDDGMDKRSDVDKKLAVWVYEDFVPTCHTLLTDCTASQVDAHRVLCDLRSISNIITSFCDEHQRTCSISSPGLYSSNSSLTLSRLDQQARSAPTAGGDRHGPAPTAGGDRHGPVPTAGGDRHGPTPTAGGPSAENVVLKVLRSASYSLMGPLLSLAQQGFSAELLRQIVVALQKISWKVEACLSYSSPDKGLSVHSKVFDGTHLANVAAIMIKAQPPEEGKLIPAAVRGTHPRSNSVAVRKTSGVVLPGEEVMRTPATKSISMDDNEPSSHWSITATPATPERVQPQNGEGRREGRRMSEQCSSSSREGSVVPSEKGDTEGAESEEASYFRPRVYRRTTVSLSRNEVDSLGLSAAKKIGDWGGEVHMEEGHGEEGHGEKFYQIIGRNLNQQQQRTSTEQPLSQARGQDHTLGGQDHTLGGQDRTLRGQGHNKDRQLTMSSSFEDVPLPSGLTSPVSDVAAPLGSPTTPASPDWAEDFSYVQPPSQQAPSQQAPVVRRPVKKTKSDLSSRKNKKELQRVRSEVMKSVDITQSLGGVARGGARAEKPKANTLSKFISKHRSFGHSDKKTKKRDEFIASPESGDQENTFFESIEHFSKEVRNNLSPTSEEQLLVSVELATTKMSKSPRKKSSESMWFEITVNTNMIAQFGRTNYVIMRQLKAFQKLYDSITKCVVGSVHQLPDMPDKRGSGSLDKKGAHRHTRDGLEALLRYIAGNAELRSTKPLIEFLTPDDLFGSVSETGSEVNFELLMTFYTPDEHVEAHHSLVVMSGEYSRPVTPTGLQNPKPSTMKRGSLHLMQRDGKEDPSTVVIREEGKDALIVTYEDDRYVVVAGTFEKLVEQLACEEKPDSRFVTTFILGYRHFASGVDLLSQLIRRFRMKLAPNATEEERAYTEKWQDLIQLRVLDVITFWVKKCWPDFYRNAELLEKVKEFIASLKVSEDANFMNAAEKMETLIAEKMAAIHNAPPPIATSITRTLSVAVTTPLQTLGTSSRQHSIGSIVDINTLSAIQLARQLTLIEMDFLKALDMHELAVFTWESNSPANKPFRRNLDAYIARFNDVSFWVATEVLSVADPRGRGQLIEKFIDVAKHCLELRNYNTTISVSSGLSLAAVRRLKRSWECVSEKSGKSFQKLYLLTSPSNNHIEYRRALAGVPKKDSYIPYFGVFMRDLTFFNEGNHKHLSNGLINFSKIRTLVLKFEEIKKCQCSKYFFPSEDKVRDYCIRLVQSSESDLYDRSEILEPRDPPFEHPETTDV